ncbi:hypothetical protein tb265_39960 [Gemmatimonadetes bacterium T265]|nr:hypothetical protein tb265_39960 [Gemmatimonadetes bacterium T265]
MSVPRLVRRATAAAVVLAAVVARTEARGQDAAGSPNARALAERVARAGDGVVRFRYAVRDGVCGDGARGITIRGADGTARYGSTGYSGDDRWGAPPCEPGPARVALAVRGGVAGAVRLAVGGESDHPGEGGRAVDLGVVPAAAAAAYLLDLAARDDAPSPNRLLLGAVVADSSVVWPGLLGLARDARLPNATRREATFWAGRYACDAVTAAARAGRAPAGRADTAGRAVREQVVFALSQRPGDEREATLLRVARADRDPAVRCAALFWLGQETGGESAGARTLALYEDVLRGR